MTSKTDDRQNDTNPGGKENMTTKTDTLQHADWCKAKRTETTDYPDRGITTTHCVDCGAHQAKDRKGKTLVTPAVTGGMVAQGRGDWDITMEKAPTNGGAR